MRIEPVGDLALDDPAQPVPAANLAVVHEHPSAERKRVAVMPRGGRAGRGAHVREEQPRLDLLCQRQQVLVAPGRSHIPENTWVRALAVPSEAEAVAVELAPAVTGPDAAQVDRLG